MPPKRNLPKVSNDFSLENLPFDTSKLSEESKLIVSILIYTVNNTREFEDAMKLKDKDIKTLETKVTHLERKLESIECKLDNSEVMEIMNDVITTDPSTPVVTNSENCISIVKHLVGNKHRINLPFSQ